MDVIEVDIASIGSSGDIQLLDVLTNVVRIPQIIEKWINGLVADVNCTGMGVTSSSTFYTGSSGMKEAYC